MTVKNYSPNGKNNNCTEVKDVNGTRYFSYNTVIAFDKDGVTLISSKKWSATTGRHRSHVKNYVSSWEEVEHSEFLELYKELFGEEHEDNY